MNQPTICITGGHLTPAIAVIEEIKRRKLPWDIVFVGRSEAFEGGGSPAHEERLVRASGVPFHVIVTGRQGLSVWKVPIGLIQSLRLLIKECPSVVLSFGGYVGLPVCVAAWMLGIPVIIHEQTGELGFANRIIAAFARRVLLSSEIGIPLREALFHPFQKPSFPIGVTRPILYITGGSTGARTLNALVFPIISQLCERCTVIHQVGAADLPSAHKHTEKGYVAAEYFDASDLAWIYGHTSILIGRSGANTVAEACALGVPAIFIPLPWAAGDEQTKNALSLAHEGMAIVLNQKTLTAETLLGHIGTMMQSLAAYKSHATRVAKMYPREGAVKVVQEIEDILSRA
ncbi:UDP-N-acetylglucosamine--N-acetylmuramyl-(pentapeptide) pyrophosphoryl-undecaprenol N-acetylglucosamine transferase [Candidatus Gottesmanbacteria bacterium]|nr:UDP-N-acetylglucosamine--N-acetylmuramyl-(pentapeptide) pyrophosphoryl-undecaprenol N-acetylglucosamine transferase [Candidatus Gottesmanbacteria bacterium]